MTRADAKILAQREADRNGCLLALVREGPHADEFAAVDADGASYGFCPLTAVATLYPHGEKVETICPRSRAGMRRAAK